MERLTRHDAGRPPRAGSVLFVGSSSIQRWSSLSDDMQPMAVLNRGFGGSELAHVTHYAHRIVLPYRPRGVVLYAGDNDLARDRSFDGHQLLDDLRDFVDTLQRAGQRAPVYFVSIKPSPRRFAHWPRMHHANQRIAAFAREHPRVHYVDVASAMLDERGHPRPELYHPDGLHLSRAGYALWTAILRPLLLGELGADAS